MSLDCFIPLKAKDKHNQHVSDYLQSPVIKEMGKRGIFLSIIDSKKNEIPVGISLSPITENKKTIVITIIHDMKKEYSLINQLHDYEQKLKDKAYHDQLTHSPNRYAFEEKIKQVFLELKHDPNKSFIAIFVDIDKFKSVNDTYGHAIGDLLLISLSIRIKDSLRKEDFFARLGGDEFVIIATISRKHNLLLAAKKLAKRMLKSLSQPYSLGEKFTLQASISMGVAEFDIHQSLDSILKEADKAMYESKKHEGSYITYSLKRDD